VPVIALAILVVLVVIALIPLSIVQRFRAGTAERPARRWVATLNLAAVAFSAVLFLGGAWVTSRVVPEALTYTIAGLAAGAALGVAGVALTRWQYAGGRLRYRPNRILVLTLTVAVAARLLYGFWRGWQMWQAGGSVVPGVAASMSAGAVVLGYYGIFWAGIRRRIARGAPPP
jgi:hypothetical protein